MCLEQTVGLFGRRSVRVWEFMRNCVCEYWGLDHTNEIWCFPEKSAILLVKTRRVRNVSRETFCERGLQMEIDLKETMEMEDQETGYGELHLHLDGAITPRIAKKLAALQGIELPYEGEQLNNALSVGEDCQSLNEFLQCFDLPLKLLQTKEGISEAIYLVQEELKAEGLSYAELRFAPQLHCQGGLSQAQVIEAALDGLKRSTLPCNLILCCMRGNGNERANEETMELTGEYVKKRILADGRKGYGVAAMDLAGAEALYPTYKYKELFKKAADKEIPFTIHAGEAGGAAEVACAIEMGAARIGHGVRSYEDPAVVRMIREKGIFLEMCPTSNRITKAIPDMKVYPLREYLSQGIRVAVCTDDMAICRTELKKEFEYLKKLVGLTEEEKVQILKNTKEGAFL